MCVVRAMDSILKIKKVLATIIDTPSKDLSTAKKLVKRTKTAHDSCDDVSAGRIGL